MSVGVASPSSACAVTSAAGSMASCTMLVVARCCNHCSGKRAGGVRGEFVATLREIAGLYMELLRSVCLEAQVKAQKQRAVSANLW